MTTTDGAFDVIVIGAGIAGASVAAELSQDVRVLLLERENRPGYHTTGRSAAIFTPTYGPPVIRAMTRASRRFFENPQSEFVTHPLLTRRGVMFVGREDQGDSLAALRDELKDALTPMSGESALERVPLLRPGYAAAALFDPEAADIDVDGLHQHYLKSFRARGGQLRTGAEVLAIARSGRRWTVETARESFEAAVVVNASGAWADEIASLAGVAPVGLTPMRRTALLIAPPDGVLPDDWPMVVDADEDFYLKPDAGKLLVSPADETPSMPYDAQPEELDVAICVDRIETAFDLSVRHIEHKWAGLRNFLPDRCPVVGFDPDAAGFFWLAGQGGYGIQSAPAMARTAAALALGRPVPSDIADEGVAEGALSRRRMEFAA